MWPLPAVRRTLVTITYTPTALVCSWLVPSKKNHATPFTLKGYYSVPLDATPCTTGSLYNPTELNNHIVHFLTTHNLQHAYVATTLSGPSVIESLCTHPHQQPPRTHLHHKEQHVDWHHHYLYPTKNNMHAFYTCGIRQQPLLQWKLLAAHAPYNLLALTSSTMALFHLYTYLCGSAYSYGRLRDDIEQHRTNFMHVFTHETVHRLVTIPPHLAVDGKKEAPLLLPALGLIVSGDCRL